jgi:hypothetical protein
MIAITMEEGKEDITYITETTDGWMDGWMIQKERRITGVHPFI